MKKTISIVSVLLIVMMLFACSKQPAQENASDYADAKTVLETVWSGFGENDKFPIGGGDADNIVADAPGKFDISKADQLDVTLALPASQHANVVDAASMMHMMNANMFTGAAYKLADGVDAQAFANEYKTGLEKRQWMCGFPEKCVVIQSGNYVVTAFGNSQNIDTFKTKATELLKDAKVLVESEISL